MTLSSHHRLFAAHSLCFTKTTIAPHATRFPIPKPNNPFGIQRFGSFTTRNTDPFHLKARESEGTVQKHTAGSGGGFNFDSLLSAIELSCLFSSAVVSVGLAASGSSKNVLMTTVNGNSVGVGVLWVVLILVGGVVVRAWIRNRQWRRIRRESLKVGLVKRIEKLEEELRSSKTVVRVLSRHVEKLGKRFRVTQHDLKGPITQVIIQSLSSFGKEKKKLLLGCENLPYDFRNLLFFLVKPELALELRLFSVFGEWIKFRCYYFQSYVLRKKKLLLDFKLDFATHTSSSCLHFTFGRV